MKIALFYNRSPGTIGEYFHRAFITLGYSVAQFNTSEADQCQQLYDVYLRVDHGDYAHDLPFSLRPSAFYVVDAHLSRSWKRIQQHAQHYDLVFCAQHSAAKRLARAHWVPLGCDPALHGKQAAPQQYDIAFVGTDGGVPRKFYLQELRERFPKSFIGQAPHTEMARLYSQAKIGFHYIECTSPLKDHVSMRVYEVLASGAMLLANALAPGTFESIGLRDRRELVVYHSPRELFELVRYYLEHDDERQRIAEAGYAAVMTRHTYRHRAQRMTHLLQQLVSNALPAGKSIQATPMSTASGLVSR